MKKLKLRIEWSKKHNDFIVHHPRKTDGIWIYNRIIGNRIEKTLKSYKITDVCWALNDGVTSNSNLAIFDVDFIKEIEMRGFDKKTLKFEISVDLAKIASNFPHLLTELSEKEQKQLDALLKSKGVKLDK